MSVRPSKTFITANVQEEDYSHQKPEASNRERKTGLVVQGVKRLENRRTALS